jgi:hypothetical protein
MSLAVLISPVKIMVEEFFSGPHIGDLGMQHDVNHGTGGEVSDLVSRQ